MLWATKVLLLFGIEMIGSNEIKEFAFLQYTGMTRLIDSGNETL